MANNYDYSDWINGIHTDDGLKDADEIVKLDVINRTFEFSKGYNKEVAITNDHRSNMITFVCDRYIDGHDVLNCKLALIKWRNLATLNNGTYDEGVYLIDNDVYRDRQEYIDPNNPEAQKIIFHWVIESVCTKKAGKLRFVINFVDFDEEGQFKYKWNSRACEELYVGEGMSSSPLDDWDDEFTDDNRGNFFYDGSITLFDENDEVIGQ